MPNDLASATAETASSLQVWSCVREQHGTSPCNAGGALQGIAHFVEHITFLGSHKRETVGSLGGRSNAYTDFQHTIFHVDSPMYNATSGTPLLDVVVSMLAEVAFGAEFLRSRIEKERKVRRAMCLLLHGDARWLPQQLLSLIEPKRMCQRCARALTCMPSRQEPMCPEPAPVMAQRFCVPVSRRNMNI